MSGPPRTYIGDPWQDNRVWGAPVVLKHSPLHGLGLFTTKPVPRGTRVIPYVGPVVRAPQKAGMSEYQRSYLYKLTPDFSIDGSPAWNLARFMNHRCTGYNCRSEVLNTEDSSLYEVWIVAMCDIEPDTELTYSYGKSYWSGHRQCRCGSMQCYSAERRHQGAIDEPDPRGEGEEKKSPYIDAKAEALRKTKEIIVSYLDHSLYSLVEHVACDILPDRAAHFALSPEHSIAQSDSECA